MCCRAMCKILQQHDTLPWSYTKTNFPYDLIHNGKKSYMKSSLDTQTTPHILFSPVSYELSII